MPVVPSFTGSERKFTFARWSFDLCKHSQEYNSNITLVSNPAEKKLEKNNVKSTQAAYLIPVHAIDHLKQSVRTQKCGRSLDADNTQK